MSTTPGMDAVLRSYLLGTIAPEVRDDVERRLFSDDRIFWEQICLAEDELVDDYVNGDLDAEERTRFERCFLTTPERREKLSFSRALKAYAENRRSEQKHAWWEPIVRPLFVPSWAAAAAAILLVLLPGLTWQLASKSTSGNEVSAWLSPGLVRSVGTTLERVHVPPGATIVRLRLERDDSGYPGYRATLHLATGEEIWSLNNVSSTTIDGREAIVLIVPAELLSDADYYVRLQGLPTQKDPVGLGRYDFRVLR
jgi:hypothetical protein